MISADEALERIFDLTPELNATDTIPLIESVGRVLAERVRSRRSQPPFNASAMDGFAVLRGEAETGASFAIAGECAAGRGCEFALNPGETVRIFTGAPVPEGAGQIVVQENTRVEGGRMTITADVGRESHIRPSGSDFAAGAEVEAPVIVTPGLMALIAAMNVPEITVVRRPEVAIIATGDELRMPGEPLAGHEIVASSGFGLSAMLAMAGAAPRILPIACDSMTSLQTALELASDADMIVTMGGASVGDHDLVAPTALALGMSLAFHKVAMRPGKPVLAGTLFGKPLIGLPGNPVSAMVCGRVFLVPAVRAMLRLGRRAPIRRRAALGAGVEVNGPREHFMRAAWQRGRLKPFPRQDSSLVSVLARADALIVRPPRDPARNAGDSADYLDMSYFY